MAGYVCIAMLEDPPYNIIIGATHNEPSDWLDKLPLPSHLLCFDRLETPTIIINQLLKQCSDDRVVAKANKAFSALPYEVIGHFFVIRDNALSDNQPDKDTDSDQEGTRLYDLAIEYEEGSSKVIPDLKKAFKLHMQSADLGYWPAYSAVALAYFHGEGIKKDLNESLKWAMRLIEEGHVYGYSIAAKCFVEAKMFDQASEIWLRCFQGQTDEKIQSVLWDYAQQVSNGLVDQVHFPAIARLFAAVAEKNKHWAIKYPHLQKAIDWLIANQITVSDQPTPSIRFSIRC